MQSQRHLPSLVWLRAFETVGRHLSFTKAARELNLTQTAISHQIKGLEEFLNARLFVREPGGIVTVTAAGESYLATLRQPLAEIALATNRIMDHQSDNILTVACLATFGVKCLIPNLRGFKALYPGYSLRVRTLWSIEEARRQDYDVAILYGSAGMANVAVTRIGEEQIFPVCSRRLFTSGMPLAAAKDLHRHTVIRLESQILGDDWPAWLEFAGEESMTFSDEMVVTTLISAIEAAAEGLGILMGRTPHVSGDLAAGRLIAPFDSRLQSGKHWVAATPNDRTNLPKVQAFTAWVKQLFASPNGREWGGSDAVCRATREGSAYEGHDKVSLDHLRPGN